MDTVGMCRCEDCGTVSQFTTGALMMYMGKKSLVFFASCKTCRARGDTRSLKGVFPVEDSAWRFAKSHGLPVIGQV